MIKHKTFYCCIAMLFGALLYSQEASESYMSDPTVNAVNREPMRASYFAYSSANEAKENNPGKYPTISLLMVPGNLIGQMLLPKTKRLLENRL